MGPNPTDRGKGGVKRSLLTDGNGIPLGSTTPAWSASAVRWEKRASSFTGMLHLVCGLIVWRRAGLLG